MKPIIGITVCVDRGLRLRAGADYFYVRKAYSERIQSAGGVPLLLGVDTPPDAAARLCDAFVFTGGDDLPHELERHLRSAVFEHSTDCNQAEEVALATRRHRAAALAGLQSDRCDLSRAGPPAPAARWPAARWPAAPAPAAPTPAAPAPAPAAPAPAAPAPAAAAPAAAAPAAAPATPAPAAPAAAPAAPAPAAPAAAPAAPAPAAPAPRSFVAEDAERIEWECQLLREIEVAGKYVLGVCYGMQLINLFHGGTLYRNLPNEHPVAIDHGGGSIITHHMVDLCEGSELLVGLAPRLEVNSCHRQAVKEVAPGFRVSARAPDGVVEAIERGPWFGVEWHPETHQSTESVYTNFMALVGGA